MEKLKIIYALLTIALPGPGARISIVKDIKKASNQ
jgi:hypothetical protein